MSHARPRSKFHERERKLKTGVKIATRALKALLLLLSVLATNAIIETSRLILRHFAEKDLNAFAELMANVDFMRFSSGIFTREQTACFLFERVIAPARARLPSQFALLLREENRLIGYCGFFLQIVDGMIDRDRLPTSARLLESRSGDRSRARGTRLRVRGHETGRRHLAHFILTTMRRAG